MTVRLTVNDEEGWKLQQGIMLQLDPKNKSGSGKVSKWEGVMLRALGPRRKERLLAGEAAATTGDEYVAPGMQMVGRSIAAPNAMDDATVARQGPQAATVTEEVVDAKARKRPRSTPEHWANKDIVKHTPLADDGGKARIAVATDCANMAKWVNGVWRAYNPKYHTPLAMALAGIESLRKAGARPVSDSSDWLHHVPREHNADADYQARRSADRCTLEQPLPLPQELQMRVDGGASEASGAGCGWVLRGARAMHRWAYGGYWLPGHGPCRDT